MSLSTLLTDIELGPGASAMLDRQWAAASVPTQHATPRYAVCYVQFYEDVLVLGRTEDEARENALTKCGIEGDMRRKVQVTFVRWCDAAVKL